MVLSLVAHVLLDNRLFLLGLLWCIHGVGLGAPFHALFSLAVPNHHPVYLYPRSLQWHIRGRSASSINPHDFPEHLSQRLD